MLRASACTLVAAAGFPQMAGASATTGLRPKTRELVRNYYAAWEKKDWQRLERLLADGFTFSSPLDDHISKSDYKAGCWDTQSAFIARFDLTQVIGTRDEAFVMYACHTTNGKTFRNVEYFQFRDAKVQAVECYFGGKAGYPTALGAGKEYRRGVPPRNTHSRGLGRAMALGITSGSARESPDRR
jgi:ketosteroid isomerase-like protein